MTKDDDKKAPTKWAGKLTAFGKYCAKHKLNRDDIAEGADITASYVSMLAHGQATPSFKLGARIASWTSKTLGEKNAFALEDWKK